MIQMNVTTPRTTPVRGIAASSTLRREAGTWSGTALAAGGSSDKPAVAPGRRKRRLGRACRRSGLRLQDQGLHRAGRGPGQRLRRCPLGYKVSGGGVQTGSTDAIVNETRPLDGNDADAAPDDGWMSYVINPSGGDQTHSVWAVCGRV